MKKAILAISIYVMSVLLFTGCTSVSAMRVDTINGWNFQYNEGTDDYSLFFNFKDANGNDLSADADVAIRIENDNGDVVYEGTKSITKDNFGTYTNAIAGDRYLADVRIEPDEIKKGSSSSGTVYFTVTSDYFAFDECNCKAYACLPIEDITINIDELPLEIEQKDHWGNVESRLKITDVKYDYDDGYGTVTFTISGEKTYESARALGSDMIGYKFYDDEGYLVDSGWVTLGMDLSVGDKFKADSFYIYDITPGKTYTLQLMDYDW